MNKNTCDMCGKTGIYFSLKGSSDIELCRTCAYKVISEVLPGSVSTEDLIKRAIDAVIPKA